MVSLRERIAQRSKEREPTHFKHVRAGRRHLLENPELVERDGGDSRASFNIKIEGGNLHYEFEETNGWCVKGTEKAIFDNGECIVGYEQGYLGAYTDEGYREKERVDFAIRSIWDVGGFSKIRLGFRKGAFTHVDGAGHWRLMQGMNGENDASRKEYELVKKGVVMYKLNYAERVFENFQE